MLRRSTLSPDPQDSYRLWCFDGRQLFIKDRRCSVTDRWLSPRRRRVRLAVPGLPRRPGDHRRDDAGHDPGAARRDRRAGSASYLGGSSPGPAFDPAIGELRMRYARGRSAGGLPSALQSRTPVSARDATTGPTTSGRHLLHHPRRGLTVEKQVDRTQTVREGPSGRRFKGGSESGPVGTRHGGHIRVVPGS